jgi:NAD(P)H-dependent FMN reductase
VLGVVDDSSKLDFELIDLAVINLPFLDEPEMPALGNYQHEHTKTWSELISLYDGFIFVLPQYNWGYPAPLKNALDFLYHEWTNKPATIVTYGNHGGGKATAQLQIVLQGLHMRNTETNTQLSFSADMLDNSGHFKDINKDFSSYEEVLNVSIKDLGRFF